ncbi:MAG: hypothetical protein KKI02_11420, partial [Planctomycetes bacterium]|nr:hypothetical protein [Planctomycetota bacterium]
VQFRGVAAVGFEYPGGIPETVLPGQAITIEVVVTAVGDGVPVAGSGQLHYSIDGGGFVTVDMVEGTPNHYEATLPALDCGSTIDFYFTAEEAVNGVFSDPRDAPAQTYSAFPLTDTITVFEDAFETDQGWSVHAGAATGNWERADPQEVDYYGTITQPGDDHTPGGTRCYVTGPLAGYGAGDYDVDGGPTHLTSPVFDLEGLDAMVSYWRWYHISTTLNDELAVAVSNNGGASWVTVESIENRQTWTYVEWRVSDYVTPSSQVQIRFTADDSPNDSLVEALVDDFSVTVLVCEDADCPGDLDGDNDVDLADLSQLLAHYGMTGMSYEDGDLDGDGDVDLSDLSALLAVYGTTC